ncbi:cob(I)yrinic acid a,c-diamide adenosyltransferase [Aureibacillus halotolerans]|uniref:Corrinoid adenosyltransferase n=1 Tax=Aureibacillus halotolerans TaxID=1508390 RepID=A0A4R6TTE0_9BACI|nr:cob(I)yrinic acid a,c-diamide adenosyltransferase [Aureibacillus halotolerans]TDQ33737.1 ATP:cob(I)alamin adenosyltransferase [Aureibacillus halotolerans]
MKIYTKSGDHGSTSLGYGERVPKNHARVQAYGTLDEANAHLGLAVASLTDCAWIGKASFKDQLTRVQTLLFHAGNELSTPVGKDVQWPILEGHITYLEELIDRWQGTLPELTTFILPGGSIVASSLHLARTVVRRAEREAVAIADVVNPNTLVFLNRLSDFLFVAARYANAKEGLPDQHLEVDEEDKD